MKKSCMFLMVLLASLLTACGGGGGGDSLGDPGTGITTGVVVDPYIIGAQLEEISTDGQTVIQRNSQSSGDTGRFTFTKGISDGSIIRIKAAAKGMHANVPYNGVLKRQVFDGDASPVVVSPLTTLVANGMSPAASREDPVIPATVSRRQAAHSRTLPVRMRCTSP